MDWTIFLFGALAGSTTILGIVGILAWRWVRPFMRAAKHKAEQQASGETVPPPMNWGNWSVGGNDPVYNWTQKGKRGN